MIFFVVTEYLFLIFAVFDLVYSKHHYFIFFFAVQFFFLFFCRIMRTEFLGCSSDLDYLAKLHCLRLAFRQSYIQHDFLMSSVFRFRVLLIGSGSAFFSRVRIGKKSGSRKFGSGRMKKTPKNFKYK